MKELVVISGKGGTGKTSLTAAFAALAERKLLVDCDVDASDLPLVLDPHIRLRRDFVGGRRARIVPASCTRCSRCLDLCRYGAILREGEGFRVDPIACEGCGVCARFCPDKAIAFEETVNGEWFVSDTRHGILVHARLTPGEENSGKLVSLIRRQAREIALAQGLDLVIADGAPGVGCPVISSLTGADLALVVTEPTPSGAHDFGRAADLAAHFGIPTAVCINRWDINPDATASIEEEARWREISILGRVRYDVAFTRAQIGRMSIVEYGDGPVSEEVRSVWARAMDALGQGEGVREAGKRSGERGLNVIQADGPISG